MRFSTGLKVILVLLIAVGVVFRFVNLNHKVYWHDEAYTSLRAAGYTRQEIDQRLFQNQLIPAKNLLQFQHIKPGSTIADTVSSLAKEDPQHPPLYFVMTRWWMQALDGLLSTIFHSSLTTTRSLPALLSLLGLPFMYLLALELFASNSVALLATTFLAISPFDVLFAQTARQYSLLTVTVIASQYFLMRAIRLSQVRSPRLGKPAPPKEPAWKSWGFYTLAVAIGLYTHPFMGLTVIAQAVYVALETVQAPSQKSVGRLKAFLLALGAAIVLYSPWLYVMIMNSQRAAAVTDWARVFPGFDFLVKLWTLSFTSLFLDLDAGFNNPVTYLFRAPIMLLIGLAVYTVCRECDRSVWLSLLTFILVPFLLLAVPDLVLGGKRSAVSRYLISCYPGIQLAVAYFLGTKLAMVRQYSSRSQKLLRPSSYTPYTLHSTPYKFQRQTWLAVFGVLALCSLASLTVSAASFTWWNRDLSYFNAAAAQRINSATPPAIVISDIGDYYTNTGDLLSFSYLLHDNVRILPISQSSWVNTKQFESQIQGATPIVFRPSRALQKALEQSRGPLQPLLPKAELWQVPQNQ